MPQGYYTIEQWMGANGGDSPKWVAVLELPFGVSLTGAESVLRDLGKPGFYRIVHTQRVIWAEEQGGALKLRKSHAGSPESLDRMRQMFDRCAGRYPQEEVREARQQIKKNRARPK
jgi:hypothetical protein